MPYYGDVPYYYGGSTFSNHSSLMTGTGRVFSPLSTRYTPHLSTITESPLSSYSSPLSFQQRMHRKLNTSSSLYNNIQTPPKTKHFGRPLRRDRATVKIRLQAAKDNPILQSHCAKHERSVGEMLMRKFLIKDSLKPNHYPRPYHNVNVAMQQRKDEDNKEEKEKFGEEEKDDMAHMGRITRKMTRRRSSADVDPVLLHLQAEMLDTMVAEEVAGVEAEVRMGTLVLPRRASAATTSATSDEDPQGIQQFKKALRRTKRKKKESLRGSKESKGNLTECKETSKDEEEIPNSEMIQQQPQFKIEAWNSVGDLSTVWVKGSKNGSFEEVDETNVILSCKTPYVQDSARNSAHLTLTVSDKESPIDVDSHNEEFIFKSTDEIDKEDETSVLQTADEKPLNASIDNIDKSYRTKGPAKELQDIQPVIKSIGEMEELNQFKKFSVDLTDEESPIKPKEEKDKSEKRKSSVKNLQNKQLSKKPIEKSDRDLQDKTSSIKSIGKIYKADQPKSPVKDTPDEKPTIQSTNDIENSSQLTTSAKRLRDKEPTTKSIDTIEKPDKSKRDSRDVEPSTKSLDVIDQSDRFESPARDGTLIETEAKKAKDIKDSAVTCSSGADVVDVHAEVAVREFEEVKKKPKKKKKPTKKLVEEEVKEEPEEEEATKKALMQDKESLTDATTTRNGVTEGSGRSTLSGKEKMQQVERTPPPRSPEVDFWNEIKEDEEAGVEDSRRSTIKVLTVAPGEKSEASEPQSSTLTKWENRDNLSQLEESDKDEKLGKLGEEDEKEEATPVASSNASANTSVANTPQASKKLSKTKKMVKKKKLSTVKSSGKKKIEKIVEEKPEIPKATPAPVVPPAQALSRNPPSQRPLDLTRVFYTTPYALLTATPRDLRKIRRGKKRKSPRKKSPPRGLSCSSDSTGSTASNQSTPEENSDDDHQKRLASTRSNDSGFDGSPRILNCDMACHKKCEKLTGNLCGLNQKLVAEALQALKKTPSQSSENQRSSDSVDNYQSGGRITPPATNLPRFKKYAVSDFNFLKVLGKGSFGKVLLAELRDTDCVYAVKCLKKDVVLEDDDVECTLIERKVLTLATRHPYLCHLFCTFQTDSHLFFVMEYLNGGDLMFHIQKSGRFSESRARFYAAEIWTGLNFLHKKGIVYRDLKLDNVLLDFEGHIRIADFGMCKLQIFLDRTADTFCGTPDYMAPEIVKGLKYNQAVDWWSFGVLLYEMLTGQSPFSGCDEDELFWSICNERPFIPRYLSQESTEILVSLLEKDCVKRLPGHEIAVHSFFAAINWEKLERRQLEAPFKPVVEYTLDTRYFDTAFTAERPRLTPIPEQILTSMDQQVFQGFSYTNPNATD